MSNSVVSTRANLIVPEGNDFASSGSLSSDSESVALVNFSQVEIVRNNGYYAPELTEGEFKTYAEAKAYAQQLLGWITEEVEVV